MEWRTREPRSHMSPRRRCLSVVLSARLGDKARREAEVARERPHAVEAEEERAVRPRRWHDADSACAAAGRHAARAATAAARRRRRARTAPRRTCRERPRAQRRRARRRRHDGGRRRRRRGVVLTGAADAREEGTRTDERGRRRHRPPATRPCALLRARGPMRTRARHRFAFGREHDLMTTERSPLSPPRALVARAFPHSRAHPLQNIRKTLPGRHAGKKRQLSDKKRQRQR